MNDFMSGILGHLQTDVGKSQMYGAGLALSQLSAGQPVNIGPALERVDMMRGQQQLRDQMQGGGFMDMFSPDEQAYLATLPPSVAQELIGQRVFAQPTPVEPVTVNGQLVNPQTGAVIGDYRTPELPEVQSPSSTIGKLQADLAAGLIDQQQYELAIQNMARSGMVIESDGQGGFRMEQGPGAGSGSSTPTERQSSLALFGGLMNETMPRISEIEADPNFNPASLSEGVANSTGWLGNFMRSEQGQQYQALQRQWAEGVLRIQTGAAATTDEVNRVMETYFPQPGDSEATVLQKSQQRDAFARSLDPASGGNIPVPGGADTRGAIGSQPAGSGTSDLPPPPEGVTASQWEGAWSVMTPEERALFQ